MKYKYLTIYKFDDEFRWGLEQSSFELEERKMINGYKVRIRIDDELYNIINQFYERNGEENE